MTTTALTRITADVLARADASGLPKLLPPSRERVEQVMQSAIAPNTWRAYQRAWLEFCAYCQRWQLDALPASPSTVRDYIIALASTPRERLKGRSSARGALPSTSLIEQHVAAISTLHRWADHPSPCQLPIVTLTVKSLKKERARGGDHTQPKMPARGQLVRRMLDALDSYDDTLTALRDRSILLILASRGLRRSEISQLRQQDVRRLDGGEGFVLTIRFSKTDQTGATPRKVPVHSHPQLGQLCPAAALEAWLEALRAAELVEPMRPLFVQTRRNKLVGWDRWGGQGGLRPAGVGALVKRAGQAAGLSEEELKRLGAHSLRRGKITDDIRSGMNIKQIADEVGHASTNTTAGYVADAELEDRSAWADVSKRLARG